MDRGKNIMVLPEDRTVDRAVTASTRRKKAEKAQPSLTIRRSLRSKKDPVESAPVQSAPVQTGPVQSAPLDNSPSESDSSSKEFSREIYAGFKEGLSHGNVEEDEVECEADGDSVFLENQISDSRITKKVIRDSRGRFLTCSEGSSAAGRKTKTKRDLSWRLTGSVLGGPSQYHVLRSFGGHVAFTSWTAPETTRSWLKCYEKSGLVEQLDELKLSDPVVERVRQSGLGHLSHCMTSNLDENLISAFVERWQPDTNTFHMPFGEVSILLHDVFHLLAIRVDGERVFLGGAGGTDDDDAEGSGKDDAPLKAKLAVFLGVDVGEIGPPTYKSGGLMVQRLRKVVQSGNQQDSFRAYMMLLLGQTLFLDKSGDRVIARIVMFKY